MLSPIYHGNFHIMWDRLQAALQVGLGTGVLACTPLSWL